MISKTLGTLILTACLSAPVLAQVAETPPSQTSWGYVNEEEKERFEQIIAPFESGEIGPMDPSNYSNPKECTLHPQYVEWVRHRRQDGYDAIKDYTLAFTNMYQYVRAVSVLETQDCSCEARNPPTDPVSNLFYSQPISKLTGMVMNTNFFSDLTRRAVKQAEAFCGGQM